jgi:hypothetical protein
VLPIGETFHSSAMAIHRRSLLYFSTVSAY